MPASLGWKSKATVLPKLIYSLNTFPTKIPTTSSTDKEKILPEFCTNIWLFFLNNIRSLEQAE